MARRRKQKDEIKKKRMDKRKQAEITEIKRSRKSIILIVIIIVVIIALAAGLSRLIASNKDVIRIVDCDGPVIWEGEITAYPYEYPITVTIDNVKEDTIALSDITISFNHVRSMDEVFKEEKFTWPKGSLKSVNQTEAIFTVHLEENTAEFDIYIYYKDIEQDYANMWMLG